MRKYLKPSLEIIDLKVQQNLLALSSKNCCDKDFCECCDSCKCGCKE